jgi:hypothetical protein
MRFILAVALLVSQLAEAPPFGDLPPASGVYFRKDAYWQQLKTAALSGAKTKGLTQYIQTDGYIPFQTDLTCINPRSEFRISSTKPIFYVRGVGSPTDAMILQFSRKKDSRYIEASPSDATIDNKGGFSRETIRKVKTVSFSDKSFSVTPVQELKPGEYLLIFGGTAAGYDFGVDAR